MSYNVIASQPIVIDNVSEGIASCLFNFWHHLLKGISWVKEFIYVPI